MYVVFVRFVAFAFAIKLNGKIDSVDLDLDLDQVQLIFFFIFNLTIFF